jgi:hypothetical protein
MTPDELIDWANGMERWARKSQARIRRLEDRLAEMTAVATAHEELVAILAAQVAALAALAAKKTGRKS